MAPQQNVFYFTDDVTALRIFWKMATSESLYTSTILHNVTFNTILPKMNYHYVEYFYIK
jgi:hypothetical protein